MTNINEAPLADRFALLDAEFKALKKQYEALKEEALTACMAAAGDDLKATVNGDHFFLDYSLTATKTFKVERALELGYITKEQIEECKVGSTRQNLAVKIRAKVMA
ncbi:hypothetical protein UFOVP122_18 [uncultured Caudovirales phage]|uniref:Uncharacterized protein n=1 Tax=uncultured Caudovirales phage TaxID=2100421 RepID=A0A6J5L7R1_9CAUD|nr:hypothetical protein UFOVP122_18 [uncultured Caudovirales phage]